MQKEDGIGGEQKTIRCQGVRGCRTASLAVFHGTDAHQWRASKIGVGTVIEVQSGDRGKEEKKQEGRDATNDWEGAGRTNSARERKKPFRELHVIKSRKSAKKRTARKYSNDRTWCRGLNG